MVAQVAEEVRYPDGRVGLASTDEIASSGYANGDLAPLPIERRTWTTYNYTALWIGMSPCIPDLPAWSSPAPRSACAGHSSPS
jgi:cytosine/uracil/thiamine/allantoin permease